MVQCYKQYFDRTVEKLGIAKQIEYGKPKEIRLYNLRKHFRNNARCDPHYIQFWMAHKLDHQDEAYISRDIERHREEYMRAYQHLTIYEQADTSELERLKKELSERDLQIQVLTKAILDIARQTGSQVDISLNAIGKPTEP